MKEKHQDVSFTVLIPPAKYAELKQVAANSGMSLGAFMRQATYEAAAKKQNTHSSVA